MQTVIPAELPRFFLTEEQRAKLDLCRSDDSRTMFLQVWHQAHCYRHRQIVGVFGSLDPARFSREWNARQGEFLADAYEAYLGPVRECAE